VTTVLPALAWTLASFLNAQAVPGLSAGIADASSVESAISIDRIRVALERPVVLDLNPPREQANFRVEIVERHEYADWLKPRDDDKPEDPLAHVPLANYNVGSLIGKLISTIQKSRHAAAERDAQDEVRRAMEAFCAVNDCSAVPK